MAIKLERLDCDYPLLAYEAKLYDKFKGVTGVPQLQWFGVEGEYTVMVLDILGPTVNNLFEFCNMKFDYKTIMWLASQMMLRIESIHQKNFIHRDIKPENFLIGAGKK